MGSVQQTSTVDKGANGCARLTSSVLEGRLGIRRAAPARALTPFLTPTGTADVAESSPPSSVRGLGGSAPVTLTRKPTNLRGSTHQRRRAIVALLHFSGLTQEAKAVEACGKLVKSFKCGGAMFLEESGGVHRSHRVEKRLLCGRPYCPTCGEVGSAMHRRKAGRVQKNIFGIRLGKMVVTVSRRDLDLMPPGEELREDARSMRETIAQAMMVHFDVPAAEAVPHPLGDRSQGLHFECWFPHNGTMEPAARLRSLEATLTEALGMTERVHVDFQYISPALPVEDQAKKWFHMIRYACHPSLPAGRLFRMGPDEIRAHVSMWRGFRMVQGFGLWADRKIKGAQETLSKLYPMPEMTAAAVKEPDVYDGAACPAEGCPSTLSVVAGVSAAHDDGAEIAPGVFLFTVDRLTEIDRRETGRDLMTA